MSKPVECGTCGIAFAPRRGRESKYCSRTCYAESLRGTKVDGVAHRTRTLKGHPIAPPCGVLAVARINLYEKIGPGPHACNWCGIEVDWNRGRHAPGNLIADHLNWDATDDAPGNLVASCNLCNTHRHAHGAGLIGAEEPTVIWGGSSTRAVERACEYCGSAFLTIPAEVKKGKGRFCSRSCARRAPRRPQSRP